MADSIEDRYLDLLRRVLTRYEIDERRFVISTGSRLSRMAQELLIRGTRKAGFELARVAGNESFEMRAVGRDQPLRAETMVGLRRLENLEHCIRTIDEDGVPGDLLEAGVWRGGASIYMKAVLHVLGDTERRVVLADSFRGLPEPDERYEADRGDRHHTFDQLAVPKATVEANFRKYGLLDDRIVFLEGWFKDTLPKAPVDKLALLRLDGDMYQSTMDIFDNLYDKVSPGGFVIVDDYALSGCKLAVDEFRTARGIDAPIEQIDWTGAFWRVPS